MKRFTNTQSGRSMAEVLCVLALIGILTIFAVFLFKHFHAKNMAQTIIKEAQMNHIHMHLKRTNQI